MFHVVHYHYGEAQKCFTRSTSRFPLDEIEEYDLLGFEFCFPGFSLIQISIG